ncbi:PD-(D/E)XK nuclease family protein [Paucihalobacter sp.]|uniref:PD-(D/E)XK nuclease family protein n=1 Tax=Paucihalobacter sp. TaxID=2850405 RepID=UPI003D161AED
MKTFIAEVVAHLIKKDVDFNDIIFILPNKRAGLFLKKELSLQLNKTFFAPDILSSEAFFGELSQLHTVDNIEALFVFYEVYLKLTPKDQIESFDMFSSWAQLLINDFIEIDRYLIEPSHIFDYLSAIKDIDHWSLDHNQTENTTKYLSFWKRLITYYNNFNSRLLRDNKGHQGLQYREAINNLEGYLASNNKTHIFVGFNALNKAEEVVFQELAIQNRAEIFWDVDAYFFNNTLHDVGLFLREYHQKWPFYKSNSFNWISDHYTKKKNIKIIGAIKNVGQIKQIGAILKDEFKINNGDLSNTAVVLGDENQLTPILNSIPANIEHINITMGLPLKSVSISSFFELLFNLHQTKSKKYYYKEIIALLNHTAIISLYSKSAMIEKNLYIQEINTNNITFIDFEHLKNGLIESQRLVNNLFSSWEDKASTALNNCIQLIIELKNSLSTNRNQHLLDISNAYKFYTLFNELKKLISKNDYVTNIQTLFGLYKELLKSETIDFRGEPLRGLQIMGVLESRLLDFENVIISGVNEGILPAGKQHNSFIPFDVKIENGLPTYKEKDAIYAYHFYRLLQRAKKVYILYNTEADVLIGGEPSRFIKQLQIENIHNIENLVSIPKTDLDVRELKRVKKSASLITDLKLLAEKGFSPSSLTNYIRNPIDFYYSKVLNIKETEEVEETVAANTLGNVIHKTLEDFYLPYVGMQLEALHIKNMIKKVDDAVYSHFKYYYRLGDFTKGKNLIIFEVAKRYVFNFLKKELETLKSNHTIKIIALEQKVRVKIDIPELDFPVFLNGIVDRIDIYDDTLRIIDYKSGKVEQRDVEIVNWEDLTSDYKKYSKSFQLLTYAFMLHQNKQIRPPITAGIISFKNLQGDYVLNFSKKDKNGGYANKDIMITEDTLDHYFNSLQELILEIFNPSVDFVEKET